MNNLTMVLGILSDINKPDHQKYFYVDKDKSIRIMVLEDGIWNVSSTIEFKVLENKKVIENE